MSSARGLFRATGNKRKPRIVNFDGDTVDEVEREPTDFYPTPPEPTRAFLHAERKRLAQFPLIWEPACGDGAMAREMEKAGHRVECSDMIDRNPQVERFEQRSFFDYTDPPEARALVTNPPFSLVNWRDGKARWITHALETLQMEYMALLLPWPWPGAAGLQKVWTRHPPAVVYLMRWKIDFTGEGAPPMLNAWFVWDVGHRGETILRMLDRHKDSRQGEML